MDEYPAVVYALQGGVIICVEADGRTEAVNLPTGVAVFCPADSRMHVSINSADSPLESVMVEFKR